MRLAILAALLWLAGCNCFQPVPELDGGGGGGAGGTGGGIGGGAGGGVGGAGGGTALAGGLGAACGADAGCAAPLGCDSVPPRGYCNTGCGGAGCGSDGICLCVDHAGGALCQNLCLRRCAHDGECRQGYSCQQDLRFPDGGRGCWANNLRAAWDGLSAQPCTGAGSCTGGSCLLGNGPSAPGFCATICGGNPNFQDAGACRPGPSCLKTEQTASGAYFCAYACESSVDCPVGFECGPELADDGTVKDGGRRGCTSRPGP